MKEEIKKKEVEIVTKESKFASWFDNFWYHHKWPTIIAIFFVIVILVCVINTCSIERSDLTVVYVGDSIDDRDKEIIEYELSSALPKGFAEQELPKCELMSYFILTKDQIELKEQETHPDNGEQVFIDKSFITSQKSELVSQLQTGQSSIYLIDAEVYQDVFEDAKDTLFMPLKDILGETPDSAFDEYGIYLCETDMYKQNYRGLQALSDDTIICVAKKPFHKSEDDYTLQLQAFKAFVKSTIIEE